MICVASAVVPHGAADVAGHGIQLGDQILDRQTFQVGAGNRIELWSPERWSKFSEQMDQPEALAESLQGLGI